MQSRFSFIGAFLLLSGFLYTSELLAQDKGFPITVSFYNEATSMPFSPLVTQPFHPGLALSTEFDYNRFAKSHRIFQTVGLSYYYHRYLNQAISLYSEFGYEFRISGIAFSSLVGVGYMRSYPTSTEFSLDNGHYKAKASTGVGHFIPSFSLESGYYLKPKEKYSTKLFLRYQAWVQYPFSRGFIDIMPHSNLHLGVKFFI